MPDGNLSEIERRVAADRVALADALDQLTATLAPERLKGEAARTAQTVSHQVWGAARENPAAFALVGAGLALLLSGAGRRAEGDGLRQSEAADPAKATEGLSDADAEERRGRAGQMTPPPSARRLRGALNRGLEKLPPAAQRRVLDARLAAIRAQDAVERRAAALGRQSARIVDEQPVAVGAAAFGIGALIGALLPGTDREDALMGAQRDALMAEAEAALRRELAALQNGPPTGAAPTDAPVDLSIHS